MPDGVYPSSMHVLVVEKITVGFIWLLYRSENEVEIYIMVIASEYRRKGYAEYLITNNLLFLKPKMIVSSRVKRKLREMKELLRKLGFKPKFSFLFQAQYFFRVIS